MYHLAIECSGFQGSLASFEDTRPISEVSLPAEASSVQSLAPAIYGVLAQDRRQKPDFISVTVGPGSFTSLRVGIATAKLLGFAWDIPIVPVCPLQSISARCADWLSLTDRVGAVEAGHGNRHHRPVRVVAVLNAFRQQVFAAGWSYAAVGEQLLAEAQVVDATAWCQQPMASLQPCVGRRNSSGQPTASGGQDGSPVLLSGPGLAIYTPAAARQLLARDGLQLAEADSLWLAPAEIWEPRGRDVGSLGWEAYCNGMHLSPEDVQANYVRASAAEEKRQAGSAGSAGSAGAR
jgi:tRNA threonylcarbamoyl adenosine modification protein YeaZ